jgi:hypothetical protein
MVLQTSPRVRAAQAAARRRGKAGLLPGAAGLLSLGSFRAAPRRVAPRSVRAAPRRARARGARARSRAARPHHAPRARSRRARARAPSVCDALLHPSSCTRPHARGSVPARRTR